MKARLFTFEEGAIRALDPRQTDSDFVPNLLLIFGLKSAIQSTDLRQKLEAEFPASVKIFCSTAGEIAELEVHEDSVKITALSFEFTTIKAECVQIRDYPESKTAGAVLAGKLPAADLCYLLVLSDGALVNGSDLIEGIDLVIKGKVPVTGGLAGDGPNFESTVVGLNENLGEGNIVAIGFYGSRLKVGHGSMGGWDVFGPEKIITKSKGNVLYEIGGKNALTLYKEYLGKYASELPGSALLFPLSLVEENAEEPVVRTILSIDNEHRAMVFAGDVPEGGKVRFMKANFDKLIDAASGAAQLSFRNEISTAPDYVLLISCVGRKLILKNRAEEEVEAVAEAFAPGTVFSGFYSYGELSPFNKDGKCRLHNQTMTITTFKEI